MKRFLAAGMMLAGLSPSPHVYAGVTGIFSDACHNAYPHLMEREIAVADQSLQTFERLFGSNVDQVYLLEHPTAEICPKLIEYCRFKIAELYKLEPLRKRSEAVCETPVAGYSGLIALLESEIGKCKAIIAEAASKGTAAYPRAGNSAWHGTSDSVDCAKANSVERSSAYWGYMCVREERTPTQAGNLAVKAAREVQSQNPRLAIEAYNKAAAAFRQAGAINQAEQAANEAAKIVASLPPGVEPQQSTPANPPALSTSPNLPPQQSGASEASPPMGSSSCPPLAPAKYWQGGPNADYCANANCVDRSSALYGVLCYPHKAEAAVNTDKARPKKQPKPLRHKEPDRFSKAVAPDVASEIQALAHEIMGMQDNDPDRPARIRKLMRLMADHGVPVRPEDMACLQPMNASSPKLVDVPLRWHPYHIKKEAIERSHLCDDAPDGDAKESCREEKYGQAVMWAEPELAGQCRGMGDIDAVAECAKRKFLNAWAKNDGIVSAPVPQNRNISPECNASVPPVRRADNLRDRLRALLAQEGGKENGQIAQPLGGAPMAANPTTIAPPAPTPVDDDEAYCNYMAREVVRGELTPDPRTAIPPGCRATVAAALALKAKQQADGDRPFTMNADDTDREIAKLLGPAEKK